MIANGDATPVYSKSKTSKLIGCILNESTKTKVPVCQANRTIFTERIETKDGTSAVRRHRLLDENCEMKDSQFLSGWDKPAQSLAVMSPKRSEALAKPIYQPKVRVERSYQIGISKDGGAYCTLPTSASSSITSS